MWFAWQALGIPLLLLSMFAVEHEAVRNRTLFWKKFETGRPGWAVPAIKILGLFFFINFGVFLLASHAASPEIQDGAYVLSDHGRIIRTLSEAEFLRLKGGELRLFASGWMFFYFVPLMYWWFPSRLHEIPK